MPELAESFCYPVCLACGVAGVCGRVGEIKPVKVVRRGGGWSPNRLKVEVFTCGHAGIPWPLIQRLGLGVVEVLCDECGGWVRHEAGGVKGKGKRGKREEVEGQGVIPF